MLLKLKSLIIIFPLLVQVHAANLAAAEGDCADCNGTLEADTGVGSNNLQAISSVTRAVSQVNISKDDQAFLCTEFKRNGINGLKEKAEYLGHDIHAVYNQIICDETTNADLLKYRTTISSGRADLMSFARYYIRENNDPEGFKKILNTVVDNPTRPRGTLLDFIDFYSDNPRLSEQEKIDFRAYEVTIRRFGGVRESEL